MLFFWLNSEELAIRRVKIRVEEGGHNIPTNIIKRRYHRGLSNFFNLYQEKVDSWMLIDNSGALYKVIAKKEEFKIKVLKSDLWNKLKVEYEK